MTLDTITQAITFWTFAALASAGRWWEFKRVCSWCKCRMGGNPFARKVTHGICRHCSCELTHDLRKLNSTYNKHQ